MQTNDAAPAKERSNVGKLPLAFVPIKRPAVAFPSPLKLTLWRGLWLIRADATLPAPLAEAAALTNRHGADIGLAFKQKSSLLGLKRGKCLREGFTMAKLIFIDEKLAGRSYELALTKTTVGRGDHNALTIRDASVSQTHCEILVHGPEVIVHDLGSSNGTFVDGVLLHNQQRQLKQGQIVRFGSVKAQLELEATSLADGATDITAFHSHARFLRQRQEDMENLPAVAKPPADAPPAIPGDNTLRLPRPPHAGEKLSSLIPERASSKGAASRKTVISIIAVGLALGVAVLLWLVFAGK